MDQRVIVVLLSVLFLSDLISANEDCPTNTIPEHVIEVVECSGTCFEVVKPFLNYFRELKTAADKSNEFKSKLMEVLKEVEIKDQLIDTLNATIKSKDEQIQTLIKNNDEQRNLINLLTKNNYALIKSNEALLIAQSDNQELIKIIKSEITEKNEELKKISEDKDEVIKKLHSWLDQAIENNRTFIEKDKEIQEKTDQCRNLTREINVICQNSICDEINSCTTAEKGIYNIKLPGVSAFEAPCNGSGWLVIQRRMDGSVDFNRSWTEYKEGFGNLTGEFFLGLEKLHQITQSSQYELLISLGKVDGSRDFVKYDNFKIGSEENSYPLESYGNYTGGAGDSLNLHVNMKFSTYDRDNDVAKNESCVTAMGGGWWFHECGQSSLNGRFYKDGKKDYIIGIVWGSWQGYDYTVSLTFVEMMIRPKLF